MRCINPRYLLTFTYLLIGEYVCCLRVAVQRKMAASAGRRLQTHSLSPPGRPSTTPSTASFSPATSAPSVFHAAAGLYVF